MKKFIIFYIILTFFMMIGVTFAHHANEKYCFDCMHKYKIGKKKNDTYKFEIDLQTNELSKKVDEQIKNKDTGLVSYILFENNKILVDQNRKSKYKGPYPSHSLGKSMVSLVTGYAVCSNYINHTVFDRIDYPTVAGTLYENQRLIDLLNMTAGDDPYVGQARYDKDNRAFGFNVSTVPIKKIMKKHLQGKEGVTPGVNYNYSALTTNVIMNYVIYKTGDDWNKLLHKIFVEDAKVAKRVYFGKSLEKHNSGNRSKGEYGRYSFYADRYDYIRIANLMMNHWNNDTCVGKYLKTMYENRVSKGYDMYSELRGVHRSAQSYGGQFHFDPIGIEDRPILMMDGFAGQQLVIDFDNNRIITIHSTDRHYDFYSLVYKPLGAKDVVVDTSNNDDLADKMWLQPTNTSSSVLDNLDPSKEITQKDF